MLPQELELRARLLAGLFEVYPAGRAETHRPLFAAKAVAEDPRLTYAAVCAFPNLKPQIVPIRIEARRFQRADLSSGQSIDPHFRLTLELTFVPTHHVRM